MIGPQNFMGYPYHQKKQTSLPPKPIPNPDTANDKDDNDFNLVEAFLFYHGNAHCIFIFRGGISRSWLFVSQGLSLVFIILTANYFYYCVA
ncbi:hypothetical protein M3P05_00175 [Sansalvadorimonas sp. 2012CJ34-2]|uniref:Transmembrane protein n=1 Tax=Parendozoicomonas callyspongiae TaxID=2942213 RepID=A0ABT0PAH6_9GAMM|nr:hypothetical protein [Sansalvadorimonas sp. 2012CJ34-2]MCL6268364.1 hypothetical protein [Sansalvadorimonas sp. 2012CJ34-2]